MVVSGGVGLEEKQSPVETIRVEHDYMGLNGKHASSSSASSSQNQSSTVEGQRAAGVKTELSLGLGLSQSSSSSSSSSSPIAEVEESGKEGASSDTLSWFSRLISQQQQQQQKNTVVQCNGSSSVFLGSKLGPSVTPTWAESTSSVYRLAVNPIPNNLPTKRGYVETIAAEPKVVTHVTTPSGANTGAQPPAWPFAWKATENSSSTPVVGWPPVRSFRKNTLSNSNASPSQPKNEPPSNNNKTKPISDPPPPNPNPNVNPNPKPPQNSLFVKANMDGVPIGRKIDLKSFNNYESLKLALEDMFQPFTKENLSVTNPEEKQHVQFLHGQDYVLTHEDKDGDWMFVGDVPWQMFITTVKRLRVMRSSEASGLGWKPRAES